MRAWSGDAIGRMALSKRDREVIGSIRRRSSVAHRPQASCSHTCRRSLKRCSQLWLWFDCECDNRAMSCNIVRFRVHNCDCECDATVMWLRPEINMFISLRGCTRSQQITTLEPVWAWSTCCVVIVYRYFYAFRLTKKGNLSFAVIF